MKLEMTQEQFNRLRRSLVGSDRPYLADVFTKLAGLQRQALDAGVLQVVAMLGEEYVGRHVELRYLSVPGGLRVVLHDALSGVDLWEVVTEYEETRVQVVGRVPKERSG